MARTIIVATDAESIRALAALENQRQIERLAGEIDRNNAWRQSRQQWERYQEANGIGGGSYDDSGAWIADPTGLKW